MKERAPVNMKRRRFLQVTVGAGGAFVLYIGYRSFDDQSRVPRPDDVDGAFKPNAYITITSDDRVLLACNKAEMGQGVLTSYAMLAAEELGTNVEGIQGFFADSGPEYRVGFGNQVTGGSSSTPDGFYLIRRMAASAREMLLAAAAGQWGVAAAECRAKDGRVHHEASGKTATFGSLAEAAARQSVPKDPPIKSLDQFEILGTSPRRLDNLAKVTGKAGFGLDTQVPGLVKAYIIHAPSYKSRPKSVDAEEAKKMPGVLDVVAFEYGVAVAADKIWQAKRAAATVKVEWEVGPAAGFSTEALFEQLKALDDSGTVGRDDGDVDAAIAQAGAKTVEGTYTSPFLAHATMEPQNATAHVRDDVIEVWAPTQGPSMIQEALAHIMGVERQRVIVHTTYLGGGFGRRSAPDLAIEAATLSKMLDRPVQVVWSRESDIRMGYYRPASITRMRGAVSASGEPLAFSYHTLCQPMSHAFRDYLASALPDAVPGAARRGMTGFAGRLLDSTLIAPDLFTIEGARGFPYRVPNVRIAHTAFSTPFPVWPWRSVGHSFNGFVVEAFVDELAEASELDPYEFRKKYLPKDSRLREVLDRAATLADWGNPAPGFKQGIAAHEAFGGFCAQVIEARVVNRQLEVGKVSVALDVGFPLHPDLLEAQAQSGVVFGLSAALHQQLDIRNGEVQQGNFDTYPALRMYECGDIEVDIVKSNREPAGAGEVPLPPTAPALAGAIYAATGVRMRQMPFLAVLREKNLVN